jgi:16S rRNA (adenine1518-N6/adenine1519-N6)-dimethyltransferase
MVLIIQKEVGQRICARPPRMNLLAVAVQFYAKPEIVSYIQKESFWPEPKVDSAIIKIIPKKRLTKPGDIDVFFKVIKAGFSQPRKQLVNNLARKLRVEKEIIKQTLQKNNISPYQRPETLSLKDWENLAKDFSTSLLL